MGPRPRLQITRKLSQPPPAKDQLQDMATSNFQLYGRIADDRALGKALLDCSLEG